MYIVYSGAGGRYASAAISKRNGSKTSIKYTYLGSVIDREKGVYKNKERGVFTFDSQTGEYGKVPDDFEFPPSKDARKHTRISLDFGDSFFLDSVLHKSGLMDVVDKLQYGNKDTLHAMLLFYVLSGVANCDAIHWYEGNIVSMLYPRANMTSQRISDFLEAIGTSEKQMIFQKEYIQYVMNHQDPDRNILIDSSGLPNRIHFPLTHRNIHNGKVNNEIRLIFVIQKSTGLPLFYRAVPGNIVDVSTLERIFLHLQSLGIDIDSCIMDAGYNSSENLDLFYDEFHQCKIGYITRVKSNDKELCRMIEEDLPTLDRKEHFVNFEDRYLFIRKKQIMAGSHKDNPAWLYLGLDCNRLTDEQRKLFKRASRDNLSPEDVYEAMQTEGLFGVISGKEYSCEEILPAYYQRQAAEQIFDFAKNYTKLLPLRISTEETFQGHLLLSYIASCAVKLMQMKLKSTGMLFGSRLSCMRNQKCTIYSGRLVTDNAQREATATYAAFGIKCPASIPILDGVLQYTPPEADTKNVVKKSRTKAVKNSRDPQDTEATSQKPARGRGRPPGSKNKKTVDREVQASAAEPKKRGRPPGSKNKKSLAKEASPFETKPRKWGRPPGSKNKKAL